ncbi:hypothetical protein J2S43_006280 [Catenuloplanes nepalensis]|uniref:PPE family domain-containing protein n=1 Tax=Catenuloplanes nepalensis TaxID=587533 RepID=A0ABT9N242_9ACTN|nr:hypothetical protein [Catenuloplanes nepalensis]MDP9797768.1 hypothetical protein [Catenuloplanes nepalensis]
MALDTGREDWTGTPWHSTDVPFMWSTVAHHSPDAYAAHLSGWHRTTELLSEHVSRMRAYRDNLALAWNPTRSPAAAVYLARFDTDIANAQATLDASIANYAAYTAALNIVSEAQTALRPIAEEYSANATSETSRQEMVSASGGRAAAAAFTAAPDTRGRQAELTGMARSVMYRASQELIEATATLQIAPKYQIRTPVFTQSDQGLAPPSIPTVLPLQQAPQSQFDSDLTTQKGKPGSSTISTGPILSHTSPLQRAPVSSSSQTNPAQDSQHISANAPPGTIGIPGWAPAGKNIGNPVSNGGGHIIGFPPSAVPRRTQTTNNASTKHPPGGANSTFPLIPPIGSSRQLSDSSAPHKDSDNVWNSSTGVDPIITSDAPPGSVDPGPAIGLDP